MKLSERSPLCGKTLATAGIRSDMHAMLVRVVKADGTEEPLSPSMLFEPGDTLWLVGDPVFMTKDK